VELVAQFALSSPVVLWAGPLICSRIPVLPVAESQYVFTDLGGSRGAYGYSLLALLVPGAFPETLRSHGGSANAYFEAAAVIIALVLLGQVLELRARSKTSGRFERSSTCSKVSQIVKSDGTEEDCCARCR